MNVNAGYDLRIDAFTPEDMMQIAALVAHTYGVENIKVYREGLTVTLAVTADVSLADCLTITRQVEDILADREPIQ